MINYIDISLSEGDVEFLLELLDGNIELAQASSEPEAKQVIKMMYALVTTLNLQLLHEQAKLGTASSH